MIRKALCSCEGQTPTPAEVVLLVELSGCYAMCRKREARRALWIDLGLIKEAALSEVALKAAGALRGPRGELRLQLYCDLTHFTRKGGET
jgi:hypothetical protein